MPHSLKFAVQTRLRNAASAITLCKQDIPSIKHIEPAAVLGTQDV